MNTQKRILITAILVLMGLLTSQCALPTRGSDEFSANIISPHDGAVFAVGEHVNVNGGFSDFGVGGVPRTTHAILMANGIAFGDHTQTYDHGIGLGFGVEWIPGSAGEYYLQEIASRRGAWAISDPVRVCVFDLPTEFWMFGYEGDCDLPERSPEAHPGSLTFSARADPESLNYYFPPDLDPNGTQAYSGTGPDNCGDPSISFIATAGDPNDDIVFVKVEIQYYAARPGAIDRHPVYLSLNRIGGTSLETKVFGNIYRPEPFNAGSFFPNSRDETYEVRWTAFAIDRSGEALAQDGPHIIPVGPCEMTPLVAPLPTEPPAPTLEPSEENCPPGTYYAPATNRCIEIQVPSGGNSQDKGKDNGGGSCKLSVSACSAKGLSFDSNKCRCVPIQ